MWKYWIAALLLVGCTQNQPGQLLKASTPETVYQELDSQTSWSQKRVALDGYIFLNSASTEESGSVGLSLYTQKRGQGERLLDLHVKLGAGPNQVQIPVLGKGKSAGYQTTKHQVDLGKMAFQDGQGKSHSIDEKVRLSGTVEYVPHFQGGFSTVDDPLRPGKKIYPFQLKDVLLEIAPSQGK
jgi:hypothetical protein